MRISIYVKEYTSGKRVRLKDVLAEFFEMIRETLIFNPAGVKEEFQDTVHFLQLWLFWRFGVEGELWKITLGSTEKFMKRREVWREIYRYVGLPERVSNYVGNYTREKKVISQLQDFGVDEYRAREAYKNVVLTKK